MSLEVALCSEKSSCTLMLPVLPILGSLVVEPMLSHLHAKGLINPAIWGLVQPILYAGSALSYAALANALSDGADQADASASRNFDAALERGDKVIVMRGTDGGFFLRIFAFYTTLLSYAKGLGAISSTVNLLSGSSKSST